MSSPVARLRPAPPPAVFASRRRFGGLTRGLLVFALACAVSPLADAQVSLLHEFIAPDPAEDVSLATTTLDGGLPAAIQTPSGLATAPDPQRPPSNQQQVYSNVGSDAGPDAYVVGVEESGTTWTCRVTTSCVEGPTVDKPAEFGLVAMTRLPDQMTAYLLRAYDSNRGPRVVLSINRDGTVVSRMEIAQPLTVDNFEGVTAAAGANGQRRFYLISDDNNDSSQRTLLLAFDWKPR